MRHSRSAPFCANRQSLCPFMRGQAGKEPVSSSFCYRLKTLGQERNLSNRTDPAGCSAFSGPCGKANGWSSSSPSAWAAAGVVRWLLGRVREVPPGDFSRTRRKVILCYQQNSATHAAKGVAGRSADRRTSGADTAGTGYDPSPEGNGSASKVEKSGKPWPSFRLAPARKVGTWQRPRQPRRSDR